MGGRVYGPLPRCQGVVKKVRLGAAFNSFNFHYRDNMNTIEDFIPQIQEITHRNGALNVRLFGSWAKGTATPSSDLDLLVDLVPGRDLFDLIGMKQELEAVTGFKVDVVTENSLSRHLREKILHEARPL